MRLLACVAALPLAGAQEALDSYGFESAAVVPGTVCDASYDSLHALSQNAGEPTILEAGEFATFYADTLCADGTEAMHVCSGTGAGKTGGASIGVVDNDSPASQMTGPPRGSEPGIDYSPLNAAEGTKFYQVMAKGVDGFTYVCFDTVTLDTPGTSVTASIQYYVAQNGWHEEPDRLRVWAETSTSSGGAAAASLLPMDDGTCVEEVHKHNIDRLMMRDSGTAGNICQSDCTEFTGTKNTVGDPAILPDRYEWKTMSADLGPVDTVKVCAGLQTGAGHEVLWLDDYQLTVSTATSATCPMEVPDYANPPRTGASVAYFSDYGICAPARPAPPGPATSSTLRAAASWVVAFVAAVAAFFN
jgi:hypothetical protein